MPFKSKAQANYVRGVAHGMAPRKGGLTREAAEKMSSDSRGQDLSKLPRRVEKAHGGRVDAPPAKFRW